MYSVTAPAFDCDFQSGNLPDNAAKQQDTLFQNTNPSKPFYQEEQTGLRPVEPSEIAAKILQMHGAAEEKLEAATRQPRLVESEDDHGFEMPGVLLRPRKEPRHEVSVPEPALLAKEPSIYADTAKRGPSFKSLALFTLIVAGASGTYMMLGMPGLDRQAAEESRLVQTELISPAPTIESLIAEDSLNSAKNAEPSATPREVALAKQRIRNAFAVGNTSRPASASEVQPLPANSTGNLEARALASGQAGVYPLYASTAKHVPLPVVNQGQQPQVTAPVTSEEGPAPTASPVLEPSTPATTEQTLTPDPAYPNTGKILASVNLRESEDKDATVLAVIPENTDVRFNECGTWWCGVIHDGKTGFVGQKYLERSVQ
ncbi:SH3 domain-containing protein [Roseibium sp.]|uniref:SH3 domain-containing protein n=1 Tax=Roseibium sp. TaxID=1936156 RepID=UPI0039EF46A4